MSDHVEDCNGGLEYDITTINNDRVSINPECQRAIRQWLYATAKIFRRIASGPYAATMNHLRQGLLHRARLCEYLARSTSEDMSIFDWNNGEYWMSECESEDDDEPYRTDIRDDNNNPLVSPNDADGTPQ